VQRIRAPAERELSRIADAYSDGHAPSRVRTTSSLVR
jgi:hypothetical protein